MFSSTKYSHLALRIGLAAVFLWFGIDKIIHPTHWLNAWITPHIGTLIGYIRLSPTQFIYLCGVLESLIGISLLTGIFPKLFSAIGLLFLIVVAWVVGSTEIIVRDIGLMGGLIALLFWPSRGNRF